jgi:hypothetical protein
LSVGGGDVHGNEHQREEPGEVADFHVVEPSRIRISDSVYAAKASLIFPNQFACRMINQTLEMQFRFR